MIKTDYRALWAHFIVSHNLGSQKRRHCSPIIIELKKADNEEDLETCAENAVRQIHDRKYYANMHGKIILIGLAFWGKISESVIETVD